MSSPLEELLSVLPHVRQKVLDADRNHLYSATAAAAAELKTMFDPDHSQGDHYAKGYRIMIWSAVEHGLSIFASSVLALRPLIRLISREWTNLLSTLYRTGSAKSMGQGSSRQSSKKSQWSDSVKSNEPGSIGSQNTISVRTEYTVETST